MFLGFPGFLGPLGLLEIIGFLGFLALLVFLGFLGSLRFLGPLGFQGLLYPGLTCPGSVRLWGWFCFLVSALVGLRGGFAIRCWLFVLLAPAPRWCCVRLGWSWLVAVVSLSVVAVVAFPRWFRFCLGWSLVGGVFPPTLFLFFFFYFFV